MMSETEEMAAMEAASILDQRNRAEGDSDPISIDQIQTQMRSLVDRVMGEASLYAPEHAAIAIKQSQGDAVEASEILRAFRQTLPQRYESEAIDTEGMAVHRRISSAFREIPDGQILGRTHDYTQRLLEDTLARESQQTADAYADEIESETPDLNGNPFPKRYSTVVEILKEQGLIVPVNEDENRQAQNILKEPLAFPAPRSASLQALARSETGALMSLGYSAMRGQGGDHPTIGELRVGYVDVDVNDQRGRQRSIGRIRVTESANISKIKTRKKDPVPYMSLGYGLCFGQNETKAICMGIVDRSNRIPGDGAPAISQEFSLYHLDGPEAKGYVHSLKLPSHVEIASELHDLREAIKRKDLAEERKRSEKGKADRRERDLV